MSAINLESKRSVKTSKLEQTILANRGMNIHLKRSLTVIEVDRKRMLKFLSRKQREVRAELKAKKDEKFNLMLRRQVQKTSNEGMHPRTPKRLLNHDKNANEIEGALFTNGLVNSPGVNHRMKRLASRRRILPEYAASDEEPDSKDGKDANEQICRALDGKQHENQTFTRQTKSPGANARGSEAFVWMTSGICSVISKDAELKIDYESEMVERVSQATLDTPANPLTNFSLFSSRQGTMRTVKSSSASRITSNGSDELQLDGESGTKTCRPTRRQRPFTAMTSTQQSRKAAAGSSKRTDRRSDFTLSRLSLVKTKIDTNERQHLMKLRMQSQKVENDDIAKKVWEFIGKRPVSMFHEGSRNQPSNNTKNKIELEDDDVLSSDEEESNRLQFLASANITALPMLK